MRNQPFQRAIVVGLTVFAMWSCARDESAATKATPAARSASSRACAADANKLCAGIQPGGGRIGKCLREHEAQLSDACKAHVNKPKAQRADQPCAADTAKFCKDIEPGGGRVLRCLNGHAAELSAACKKVLAEAQQKRAAAPAGK